MSIYLELKDSVNLGKCYNNLGLLYNEKNELNNALLAFNNSLTIEVAIADRGGQVITNLNIGNILKKQESFEESLLALKRAETLAIQLGDAKNLLHISSNLVDVNMILADMEAVAKYLEIYKTLKDSLYNDEKQRQISELQTLYETEQKENALISEQRLNKEKTAQNQWLIVLSILLLSALGVIAYINQRRMISEKITAKKAREVAALNAHIIGQEDERGRIARDLHDRLGGLLNSVKMMHSQYSHNGGELGAKVEDSLSFAANTVREVSHDLVSATLVRHGLVKAIEQYFDVINKSGKIEANLIVKGIDLRLEESIERVLDFCIQELVNNTLKYAKASQIDLQLLKGKDSNLHIIYEDDGQGFDPKTIDYGIGLKSVEARIDSIHGSFDIETSPGEGVMFTIDIPLNIKV